MYAYTGKIALINLTNRRIVPYPFSTADRLKYIGGKGIAARILYDLIDESIDPLGEDNVIVVSTGPMTGTGAPSSSRFNISTISPLTKILVSSNCGGDLGLQLKRCGYDALVIRGKSKERVYLDISETGIEIKNADHLWGKSTSETGKLLGKPHGVIGVAGENCVSYACVMSGDRAAGRGGVGAVFGSKNLKGIAAKGKMKQPLANPEAFKAYNKKWIEFLRSHIMTGQRCPDLGTAMLVRPMQRNRQLATKNFKYGEFDGYEKISGETIKAEHLVKNGGCTTCPIHCSRIVKMGDMEIKGPELETLGLLGPNLLNDDLSLIIKMNHQLDELGLDTMSTGGTLAFAMELKERGIADFGVAFGENHQLMNTIEDIAHRRGAGDILAQGTREMAKRYGAEDAAIHVKGLELAAYEPRGAYGQGLTYATGNRGGCHLNGGYMVLLEGLGATMTPTTTWSKAALAVMFQNMMEVVSSMGICLFTTYSVLPSFIYKDGILGKVVSKILSFSGPFITILLHHPRWFKFNIFLIPYSKAYALATGYPMTLGQLLEAGDRIYNLERSINLRLGMNPNQDETLPSRLTTERNDGQSVPLLKLLYKYYKVRQWKKDGTPKKELLKRLGILKQQDS
ncbi:MAG: aldehyde ferredoxin oxidoreductase family protein [Eubacteriaceae bacterium]